MRVWKFRSIQAKLRFSYTFVAFNWYERRNIAKIQAKHPRMYPHPYWYNMWIVPSKKAEEQKVLFKHPPLPKRKK